MSDTPPMEGAGGGDRPFPWPCPACLRREVRPETLAYSAEIKHDGRLHPIEVSTLRVPKCAACGELVFDNDADEQIAGALRKKLGLLPAAQIRQNLESLGLSQRAMADQLGVAAETISRWENGVLTQTRAMDRYLRVFFGVPAARAALLSQPDLLDLGSHIET